MQDTELSNLIESARRGSREAQTRLVDQYRNVVYGLAYHDLGNFDAARDVTQEVFVRALPRLGDLRDAEKLAPWLRQITRNACREWRREQNRWLTGLPEGFLELEWEAAPNLQNLADRIALRQALNTLTPETRLTILLYYFQDRSVREIAAFLQMPETSIKSRLRDARTRLRKEMLAMLEDTIQTTPLPADFTEETILKVLRAANTGDLATVETMLKADGRLIGARAKLHPKNGVDTPLLAAVRSNRVEVAAYLAEQGGLENLTPDEQQFAMSAAAFWHNYTLVDQLQKRGVPYTIHAAAHLGDVEGVREFLAEDPALVHSLGIDGETPLHVAASVEVARILVNAGADLEARDRSYDNTPLEYNFRPARQDVRDYLLTRGANVRFTVAVAMNDTTRIRAYLDKDPTLVHTRSHSGRPAGPALPLTIAAEFGAVAALGVLLDYGADVNTPDERRGGATPLHIAAQGGYAAVTALLLDRGADPTLRATGNFTETPLPDATPAEWAEAGKALGWGVYFPSNGSGKQDEVLRLLTAAKTS